MSLQHDDLHDGNVFTDGRVFDWGDAKLARADVDVLVLDRNNYHGFWPLLYQVATAGLDPASIAYPARAILRKYPNTQFLMAEVQFGWLIRSIHSWAANLMIFTLFVHLFSVLLLKAYRPPREVTWFSGMALLGLDIEAIRLSSARNSSRRLRSCMTFWLFSG